MGPAIVAALIGAAAVVIGVYLSQALVTRSREAATRRELSLKLTASLNELFSKMGKGSAPEDWTKDVLQMNRQLQQIESACAHLGRKRRKELYALIDECSLVYVNASGRAKQAGGELPEEEQKFLMYWTMVIALSISDQRGIADPHAHGAALDFYAREGLNARRPGAPPFKVPARNSWQRLRNRWAARKFRPESTTEDGTTIRAVQ